MGGIPSTKPPSPVLTGILQACAKIAKGLKESGS